MLCAISGEAPQVPVASRKSGNVFEKRLIEQYISENGRDPVTGEELSVEDLVELKTARVVKPRPPTFTSIPSLLSAFQNEWDALALECYTLQQHLSQLRQELSTALYSNDAAVRVVARLTKERDEARDALSRLSIGETRAGAGGVGASDAMQVDGASLPNAIVAKVDATQEKLSKTRRKRPVPEDWATSEQVEALDLRSKPKKVAQPGSHALALDKSGTVAVVGGADGSGSIFSISQQKSTQSFKLDSPINDIVSVDQGGATLAVAAMASGEVAIIADGSSIASFKEHTASATALAVHASEEILLSVGEDKSFVLYDLVGRKVLSRSFTASQLTCCEFHPDGHIFAVGGNDGKIQVFETKSGDNMATFDASKPLQALSFSENGTWLASVVKGASTASIWDLRKAAEIHSVDFGGNVNCIGWDYTGQYLAGAGPGGVTVQKYDKASKEWSQPLMKAVSGTAIQWGAQAKSLVLLSEDGTLSVLT